MHPRTKATLDELRGSVWFFAVGQPVDGPLVALKSWDEAIASCRSEKWGNLQLEAANRYREAVLSRSRQRYELWNVIAEEMRTVIVPLVDLKAGSTIEAFKLPKVFRDTVEWDMLHLCMESELADVYPPGFFASQAFWYVRGHFPCGWNGEFPEGDLVLY
jgi:hypothetical protein